MNIIIEFAKFRDVATSSNKEINLKINKEFDNDTRLIYDVYIIKNDKHIILRWNDIRSHPMIERIKDRTSFKSISEFNSFIEKAFNDLFDNHFNEIDNDGRYALHFLINKFYLLVDINYDNLFSKYTHFFIATVNISSPDDCYKIIEINDDNF